MCARLDEGDEDRTGRVRILAPVRDDLELWRAACGFPSEETLMFPRGDGTPWHDTDWRDWRNRAWRAATQAAGIDAHPYACRHSFCTLLLAAGKPVLYVATQAGHSVPTLLSTYAHLLAEHEDEPIEPEREIYRARLAIDDVPISLELLRRLRETKPTPGPERVAAHLSEIIDS